MFSRTVKLWLHQRNDEKYGETDFVFNPKEFPQLQPGNVVEIYDKEVQFSHLLLPVMQLHNDFINRDTISVEQCVAQSFLLNKYHNVVVNLVDPKDFSLDLVELCFKEQFFSRSDMWRIKKYLLMNTRRVVYLNKQIRYCDVKCQVNEMWAKGERVACGVVQETTRVVFRTGSCTIYLFIQMSLEMWEFDYQGDLYYEKCVNGFLPDLFQLWKERGNVAHYVTIVVFSRWFYDAYTIEDFPEEIQPCILQDYQGRFYQDFYRLIVQNEYYDDWMIKPVISKLKCLLNEYRVTMNTYHSSFGPSMPASRNSPAQEGNYLEVINMSLNVFAKHYIDRNFERTEQILVILTPGQGVFKVDRNLCNLTKQRVNDVGLSLDLVCLGEQPLHAVPLFIFPSKTSPGDTPDLREDFVIPHWMNFSFYSPIKYPAVQNCFVPRIKIPESVLNRIKTGFPILEPMLASARRIAGVVDYDKYDDEVFVAPKCSMRREKTISESVEFNSILQDAFHPRPLNIGADDMILSSGSGLLAINTKPSRPMTIPMGRNLDLPHTASLEDNGDEIDYELRPSRSRTIVGSAGNSPNMLSLTQHRRQIEQQRLKARKPLMNPFKPAEFAVRITSNRRRWIHVFPVDAGGKAKQAHHTVSGMPVIDLAEADDKDRKDDLPFELHIDQPPLISPSNISKEYTLNKELFSGRPVFYRTPLTPLSPSVSTVGSDASGKTLVWAWGVTGEEQWNPDLKIGVDWKSLTIPATLPTTIDFFPDHRSLRNDYMFNEHSIFLDDSIRELWDPSRFPLDVFDELIHQRLHQGFQIIVLPINLLHSATDGLLHSNIDRDKVQAECYLCIYRIFHRLTLCENTFYAMKFLPRHEYSLPEVDYQYQFQVPDTSHYQFNTTTFVYENSTTYNWSQVDNYIVNKGHAEDIQLDRSMKYWESRFLLIPCGHPAIRRISDRKNSGIDTNSSTDNSCGDEAVKCDIFLENIEAHHRIRRAAKKQKLDGGSASSTSSVHHAEDLTQAMPLNILNAVCKDFPFLPKAEKIPEHAFVSAELVHWLINNVNDITSVVDAVAFCQSLVSDGRILHVSKTQQRFVYGFCIYYLVSSENKNFEGASSFVEVEITETPVCCTDCGSNCRIKTTEIDMDPNRKSDRMEWGQLRFGSCYCTKAALELDLQWMVATGCIVGDLVDESWSRKAKSNGFHLIPVPTDPFAIQSAQHYDPLRCAIYVPLAPEIVALLSESDVQNLQEVIMARFGFIAMSCSIHVPMKQYVHLCGGMFVMALHNERRGFYWAWNCMLGKRFKSPQTGDERFFDLMLADFRAFCSNSGNRLVNLISLLASCGEPYTVGYIQDLLEDAFLPPSSLQ